MRGACLAHVIDVMGEVASHFSGSDPGQALCPGLRGNAGCMGFFCSASSFELVRAQLPSDSLTSPGIWLICPLTEETSPWMETVQDLIHISYSSTSVSLMWFSDTPMSPCSAGLMPPTNVNYNWKGPPSCNLRAV